MGIINGYTTRPQLSLSMNKLNLIWIFALFLLFPNLAYASNITDLNNISILKFHLFNASWSNTTTGYVIGAPQGNIYFNDTTCKSIDSGCYYRRETGARLFRSSVLPESASFINNPTNRNLSCFVHANVSSSPATNNYLINSKLDSGGTSIDSSGIQMGFEIGSGFFVEVIETDNTRWQYINGIDWALNSWQHFGFVLNTTNQKMYIWINGTFKAEVGVSTGTGGTSGGVVIGGHSQADTTRDFGGVFQGLYCFNSTLTQEQIIYLNSTVILADAEPAPGPTPSGPNITITAQNSYDSIAIVNFSVILSNSTQNQTFSTINGTIPITNITQQFYNITFQSGANESFFNVTYWNVNVSGQSFQGNLTQSYINVYVNDSLTKLAISSFSYITNYSSLTSVQNGYVLLPSKDGTNHFINISSSQYPLQSLTYTINALDNISIYVNMSPRFQFYLRREADNSVFDINGTNTTRLTIYCPTKNIVIYFKNESNGGSATVRVSSQENSTVDCPFTLMKIDVTYSSSSYFRTLIPSNSQQNVTWWLLDLNKDTGVQIIINLRDLSGDFSQGILRTQTAIGSKNENIIEEYFDVATSVVLYLLKDALYKLILINNDKTIERQLGDLIADAAGTKTITVPDIQFIPEHVLDNNVSWSYTFNASAGILRLQYLDSTKNTTYIRWRIYNGTNTSKLLTTFESVYIASNFTSTTYTYNNVQFNRSYYTHLFAQHSTLTFNISEYRSFGEYESYLGSFIGFTTERTKDIKQYGSAIFLSVWMLLFSAKHLAIGLTSSLFWIIILKSIGFLLIGWIWVMIIGLVTFFAWIGDYMRRN